MADQLWQRYPTPSLPNGYRARAIDSTTMSMPGSVGTDWRLHFGINLETLQCDFFEVTVVGICSIPSSEDAIASDSSSHARLDPATTKRWAERLARFHAGSHNVAAFCAAEGVSESNFYSWRRRLAQPVPPAIVNAPAMVPLHITPSPATPIELTLLSSDDCFSLSATTGFPDGTTSFCVVSDN